MNLMKLDWHIRGFILMSMIIIIPIIGIVSMSKYEWDWGYFVGFLFLGVVAFVIGYFVYNYANKH